MSVAVVVCGNDMLTAAVPFAMANHCILFSLWQSLVICLAVEKNRRHFRLRCRAALEASTLTGIPLEAWRAGLQRSVAWRLPVLSQGRWMLSVLKCSAPKVLALAFGLHLGSDTRRSKAHVLRRRSAM